MSEMANISVAYGGCGLYMRYRRLPVTKKTFKVWGAT